MKKLSVVLLALVMGLGLAGEAMAEVKVKRDFDVGDHAALFRKAREKFMSFSDKTVVKNYKSFFGNDSYYVTACRGRYGDWVAFIVPIKNVANGYDYAMFKYPTLELISIGGSIIEDWKSWHEEFPAAVMEHY